MLLGVLLLLLRQNARAGAGATAPSPPPKPAPLRPAPANAAAASVAVNTSDPRLEPVPKPPRAELRVRLLMLVIDAFPPWWPFLVASYARSFPTYELVVVHTGPAPADAGASHVSYEATTVAALAARFASKLGAPPEVVRRKFASAKGLSDLKPFYGKVFEELLQGGCTHWGWVDWDVLAGDLRAAIPQAQLWEYDAVTLPGATLGFAWAGQLSVFQNTAELRELYRVVGDHVALGFKCCATEGNKEAGQSGWEERVFLRDVLRTKPRLRVAFNMAAQYDYKAQWLTWVPFDHYWRDGKVWRCAQRPLARPGRPPLLPDAPRLRREVAAIQRDPQAFYKSKDRVHPLGPHVESVDVLSLDGRHVHVGRRRPRRRADAAPQRLGRRARRAQRATEIARFRRPRRAAARRRRVRAVHGGRLLPRRPHADWRRRARVRGARARRMGAARRHRPLLGQARPPRRRDVPAARGRRAPTAPRRPAR